VANGDQRTFFIRLARNLSITLRTGRWSRVRRSFRRYTADGGSNAGEESRGNRARLFVPPPPPPTTGHRIPKTNRILFELCVVHRSFSASRVASKRTFRRMSSPVRVSVVLCATNETFSTRVRSAPTAVYADRSDDALTKSRRIYYNKHARLITVIKTFVSDRNVRERARKCERLNAVGATFNYSNFATHYFCTLKKQKNKKKKKKKQANIYRTRDRRAYTRFVAVGWLGNGEKRTRVVV